MVMRQNLDVFKGECSRTFTTLMIVLLATSEAELQELVKINVKYTDIAVGSLTCHTTTGTNIGPISYRITQCYLPPDRCDIPVFTPAEAGSRLSDPGGCKAELI